MSLLICQKHCWPCCLKIREQTRQKDFLIIFLKPRVLPLMVFIWSSVEPELSESEDNSSIGFNSNYISCLALIIQGRLRRVGKDPKFDCFADMSEMFTSCLSQVLFQDLNKYFITNSMTSRRPVTPRRCGFKIPNSDCLLWGLIGQMLCRNVSFMEVCCGVTQQEPGEKYGVNLSKAFISAKTSITFLSLSPFSVKSDILKPFYARES